MIEQTAISLNHSSDAAARPAAADGAAALLPTAAANENAALPDVTRLAAEAVAREKAREARARARRAERRRWLLLLAFVLALLTGLRLFATQVVRVIPGMAGVYQALGVPVTVPGFRVDGLRLRWTRGPHGSQELLIAGHVRNVSGHALPMPRITLSLRDVDGAPLYQWRIPARQARPLAAGAQVRFRSRLADVPLEAATLRARVEPHLD